MAAEVRFGLSESETELVDQLCAQFDPEQFIPQWMRERGSEADWQAYLRVERHEFREELEVAGPGRRHDPAATVRENVGSRQRHDPAVVLRLRAAAYEDGG
ncbi:MAG: hypothetical protein H0V77_05195 [Actinobacteria bacterium]|nr:hypothetical protein [Actinomycetota bacterium]